LFSEAEKITLSRIDEELIKTRERVSDSLKEKALLVGKIKVSHPQLIDYLVVFEQYAVFHDLRKEGQVRAVSFIRKIFNEAAVRLRLSEKLLYYYWPFELAAVLEGKEKLDINLLTRRSSEWFCEYTCDKQYKEWFGEEAKRERAKLLDIPSQQVKELNGIGASSGRITGKARVVFGAKEAMEKIQPGEVLVTGMTMPDFVPAMKIASAVVTDEGGLTCHAAIICRELGKACVVGTKLGTKVIKDGDLVEVNANHGVVKIL
jgi:phosphohistidine swiveling domain-containing protein